MTGKRTGTMEELCDPTKKISGQPQQIKYDYEVPKKVLDDYDWLDEDDKAIGWIKHRKRWYHLSDFMRADKDSPMFPKWDGYHSDSFFSGVLVKFTDDGDGVYIRTYIN